MECNQAYITLQRSSKFHRKNRMTTKILEVIIHSDVSVGSEKCLPLIDHFHFFLRYRGDVLCLSTKHNTFQLRHKYLLVNLAVSSERETSHCQYVGRDHVAWKAATITLQCSHYCIGQCIIPQGIIQARRHKGNDILFMYRYHCTLYFFLPLQLCLDLTQLNSVPSNLHLIIKSTKVHKLAVLIPLDTVSRRVYPSRVRERIRDELLGSELWSVVISLAHTYTTDPKLTGNTRRAECAIIRMHHIKDSV